MSNQAFFAWLQAKYPVPLITMGVIYLLTAVAVVIAIMLSFTPYVTIGWIYAGASAIILVIALRIYNRWLDHKMDEYQNRKS